MANEQFKKEIVNYYERCEVNYRRWWDLDHSKAMHAGFWDEKTKTLSDALMRENEVLADMAGIKAGEHVLDAGCGVGGSSIYLATRRGCKVTGITLSEAQAKTAKKYAAQHNHANPPEFLVRDYTCTQFPENSYDVVWGLESVCHAEDKRDFIKEAWRILKPRGRLIVADGFNVKNDYTASEKRLLGKAVNGWAVQSMESIPNFEKYLHQLGFKNISKTDATPKVLPSSRRLFYYSFPAIIWSKVGEYLGWSTNTQTNDFVGYHYQYWAVKKGLCKYMVFMAEKP